MSAKKIKVEELELPSSWWLHEDRKELEDILFKAAQEFIPNIDPAIVLERTKWGFKCNYMQENGAIDTWRSHELVITAALFVDSKNREEFEKYARIGFRDYMSYGIARTPYICKAFVESYGYKVPKHVFDKPTRKPN